MRVFGNFLNRCLEFQRLKKKQRGRAFVTLFFGLLFLFFFFFLFQTSLLPPPPLPRWWWWWCWWTPPPPPPIAGVGEGLRLRCGRKAAEARAAAAAATLPPDLRGEPREAAESPGAATAAGVVVVAPAPAPAPPISLPLFFATGEGVDRALTTSMDVRLLLQAAEGLACRCCWVPLCSGEEEVEEAAAAALP